MIADKLENIAKYENYLKPEIINFITNLSKDIEPQKYIINDKDYANIETYITKQNTDCYYEAHRIYADIQILLSGKERIDFADKNKLTTKTEYKPDIEFFENTVPENSSVYLDGSNFTIIFPNEAHKPQMEYKKQEQVKKVVVKFIP